MKGEEQLWEILQDKLEMLRAGNRLHEASRVGETALDLAQRIFPENHPSLALSYERLGQVYVYQEKDAEAVAFLSRALRIIEGIEPGDRRAVYRLARRLAHLCEAGERPEEAISYYERAIQAGNELGDVPHSEQGTMLNNIALIYRRSGRQEAAEPYSARAGAL